MQPYIMPAVYGLLLLVLNHTSATFLHPQDSIDSEYTTTLDTRQIITANPSISCCESCTGAFDQTTYMNVFDDFCGWANLGLELWTTQTYNTGTFYCTPGSGHCIQLAMTYECEDPTTGDVDYSGCMGYFEYAINPDYCGGPLYRGARIKTSDGCYVFQATGSTPVPAGNVLMALDCDDSGRWCRSPILNTTIMVPEHVWEEYVQAV
ncbi:hypothetical protein LTR09_005692 [Extremus antarcticus]|uniref:Uncharacterized protein n=1 Tax=Extremus antarcticus TaxID=702011 RepID=A0AAJ0DFK4_9PEZI|nr:hypothetical protein LTR09_005692 [Extremus antarcticus]